jgi:membrane fusion protein (multidrug efflux system)
MAVGRDQTARIVRSENDAEGDVRANPRDNEAQSPPVGRIDAGAEAGRQAHDFETPAEPASPVASPVQTSAPEAPPAKPGGRKRLVLIGAAILAVLAAASYGANYYLVGRYRVSTDDAYVRANNTTLGARVAGHIATLVAGDNSIVQPGDVLMRIDDGDYRIAVDAARAKLATQQATIDRIGEQITAQTGAIAQARAQLDSANAAVARAQSDFDRQQSLSDKGYASKATFEVSRAARDQAVAGVQGAQAALDTALTNADVAKAQQAEARGQLNELKTSLAKAERDLDFTVIRAPVTGVFSNRLVNAGDYVQPGQRLGNLVPLDAVYIDANFKETQLGALKPGQPVRITVDAIGGREFEGAVESLSPASGSVFSLLPPDNATGNFTKIVQRLPVRIRVPAAVAREHLLRAGMSVVVTVDTKPADQPGAISN